MTLKIDDDFQKEIDDLQFCKSKKWEEKNRKIDELKKKTNQLSYGHQEQLKENKRLRDDLVDAIKVNEETLLLVEDLNEDNKRLRKESNTARLQLVLILVSWAITLFVWIFTQ